MIGMKKMKIAIVWKNDYPWDVRVEKISKTLFSLGHEVHIICRNLEKRKVEENISGIFIHRLKPFKRRILNSFISTPAFFNPFWIFKIYQVCKEYGVDLLIIRDLPLVLNGIVVAKQKGIPTIFDMAENYPALWQEVTFGSKFNMFNYILKNPIIGRYLEKYCVSAVDHILAVVAEAKQHLIQLGVDEKKISIVSNTPQINNNNRRGSFQTKEGWAGKFVLLYQGYVNEARGLEVVLLSMPGLLKKFNNLLLVIVGDGDDLLRLKALSRKLKIEGNVNFYGWVSFESIYPMISHSDVCVIPHRATMHKNTTIPNKLFDYMACGKPVIVSDAKPLKRIVEEEKCGLVFASGNRDSFAMNMSRMIQDSAMAHTMGLRGQDAVNKKYNWHVDSLVLKNVIEKYGC